ncbi:MAG: PIN domain-containing protein [Archangium sp.]|nr:PIN domain-containing protein [Archangium sp.]
MPASLFVDSGAWIAFFSSRDGHHREAERLIREALRQKIPLFTSDLVLAEVHRLLLFRAGIKPAAAALDVIDKSPSVSVHFPPSRSTATRACGWPAFTTRSSATPTPRASPS